MRAQQVTAFGLVRLACPEKPAPVVPEPPPTEREIPAPAPTEPAFPPPPPTQPSPVRARRLALVALAATLATLGAKQ